MLADRQTDRHRHTQTLTSQYCAALITTRRGYRSSTRPDQLENRRRRPRPACRPNTVVNESVLRASSLNTTLPAFAAQRRRRVPAVDRYLLQAPALSSKPAARRCCCRSTGQTDGRTDSRPLHIPRVTCIYRIKIPCVKNEYNTLINVRGQKLHYSRKKIVGNRAFNRRILYGHYPPTVILTIIWYSVTHSLFHSRLKTFLFCKSFPPQLSFFLLQDSLHGFPRLFTVTSEHIRLNVLVFLFSTFQLSDPCGRLS